MRLTLVISSLDTGGAERVLSLMANYWAAHDFDVTVITIGSQEADCYALSPHLKRIGLNLQGNSDNLAQAIWRNAKRLRWLRREICASRPHAVISFLDVTNVLTLLATAGLGVPVIVSERTDPYRYPIGVAWSALRNILYRRADAVVMQSEGFRAWARRFVQDENVYVIPNPVEKPLTQSRRSFARTDVGMSIGAMGRLTGVKGYDLLLRAFAQFADKYPAWSLVILGEGEERAVLERLVEEFGLKDQVHLPGCVRDPTPILRGLDIFVMSSHYEGSSNALLEAMACGLAVISTDTSSARDVIQDDVNGILVPPNNVKALASAMEGLMNDPAKRKRIGVKAVEVMNRFNIDRVMGMWGHVLRRHAG